MHLSLFIVLEPMLATVLSYLQAIHYNPNSTSAPCTEEPTLPEVGWATDLVWGLRAAILHLRQTLVQHIKVCRRLTTFPSAATNTFITTRVFPCLFIAGLHPLHRHLHRLH
jgi:hypothetical protein